MKSIKNHKIKKKNRRLITFLDKWKNEPDNLGEKIWQEIKKSKIK